MSNPAMASETDPRELSAQREPDDREDEAAVGPGGAAGQGPGQGLRARAIRGSMWTFGGWGAGQALRTAGHLALTRLLFPEAFGIMLIVNVVAQGLRMFSDVGIGASIVQHARGDEPDFLNTAWTLQVFRGIALWLASCLLAWPIAVAFDQREYLWLLPVAALTSLILGFNSTAPASWHRHISMARMTIWELGGQATTVICTVGLALMWRSVWPLVIGPLGGAMFQLVASHWKAPIRNHLKWDRECAQQLIRFGRWIFVGTALAFLVAQGDKLVLGGLLSKSELGLYAVAFFLSNAGIEVMRRVSTKVLFPVLSRVAESDPATLRPKLYQARIRLLALMLPGFCILVIWAKPIVALLYDPRYLDAWWMLRILAAGAIFSSISVTCSPVLLAVGDSFRHMLLLAARSALLFICMVAGYYFSGGEPVGLIVGVAAHSALSYPVLAWAVRRYGVWMPRLDLIAITLCGAFIVLGILGTQLVIGS